MLKYTGHPFRDVGVATITAFAGNRRPDQLTEEDLGKVADFIEQEYVRPPLQSWLSVAFTSNAWFNQSAYNPFADGLTEEQVARRGQRRAELADYHLRQWSADAQRGSERDVFTGGPTIAVKLSKRLPPGRAGRAQVPLALGDEYINFSPGGPGIPVSGKTLLALQALPLGCAKCAGRLLAVHSNSEEITRHFAGAFLHANREAIQLARQGGGKMPHTHYRWQTLVLETLLGAMPTRGNTRMPFALAIYHFSNSGQGASLDIHHLPIELVTFLHEMGAGKHGRVWSDIVQRAWEVEPPGKRKKKGAPPFRPRRNRLYEDLFALPGAASHFIRTYFLRSPLHHARGPGDPRPGYSPQREADLVSWQIAARFSQQVLHIGQEQVERVRALGDRLVEHISARGDRRLLQDVYTAYTYERLRDTLTNAGIDCAVLGNAADWRLVRDLTLARTIERLRDTGWLDRHPDVLKN